MPNERTLHLGLGASQRRPRVTIDVSLMPTPKGLVLSISGKIGRDQAGQVQDSLCAEFPGNPHVSRLVAVWERWHLNDMHAGCEHQRAAGVTWPRNTPQPVCETCGYRYGDRWLFEALPTEIVTEVQRWIDTGSLS